MLKIKQAVVVEGKYDKIKLSSIIDGVIIVTNGYGIFKDKETLELIRYYARKTGIIILTDSDSAGFRIRGYLKGAVSSGKITNVYIPDIFGKEKRKSAPGKEGKLGVEGIKKQLIIEAFEKAGINAHAAPAATEATVIIRITITLGSLPPRQIIQAAVAKAPARTWPSPPMFQNLILNAGVRANAMIRRIDIF